jgi:hypothetical protein
MEASSYRRILVTTLLLAQDTPLRCTSPANVIEKTFMIFAYSHGETDLDATSVLQETSAHVYR